MPPNPYLDHEHRTSCPAATVFLMAFDPLEAHCPKGRMFVVFVASCLKLQARLQCGGIKKNFKRGSYILEGPPTL